jgi:hypothetical protein
MVSGQEIRVSVERLSLRISELSAWILPECRKGWVSPIASENSFSQPDKATNPIKPTTKILSVALAYDCIDDCFKCKKSRTTARPATSLNGCLLKTFYSKYLG